MTSVDLAVRMLEALRPLIDPKKHMSSPALTTETSLRPSEPEDGPAVRWLAQLLEQAVQWEASDIHIEPRERDARVRLRIDGCLQEVAPLPAGLRDRVASRIKVLSRLDIAERRLPQDGRVKLQVDTHALDCRVSTLPTLCGEKLVLRLQQTRTVHRDLATLGLEPDQLESVLKKVHAPQGLVLVTGPTGSGKTVSLYACLQAMDHSHLNISTVEDPIEIELPGINQVQVHEKAGLTFSTVLRAFLRQDPDVLMVGEIRDLETADMAVKAAQTGHLVLSTLHTNDAPSTLGRLMHMGVPSHLLAGSVKLVMAQRLVRRLCDACKIPVHHDEALLKNAGMDEPSILQQGLAWQAYAAQGCAACHQGYKGRVGVFQVMPITASLQHMMCAPPGSVDLAAQAAKEGVDTLRSLGLRRMRSGQCSLEEIVCATPA
jgi:type IV pilus assembly protein PilB